MDATLTSIRLKTKLADEAAKVLGVKTRTEAIHEALERVIRTEKRKAIMRKYAGKLSFPGYDE
jgi:Arc/MetJ family transcription regulator